MDARSSSVPFDGRTENGYSEENGLPSTSQPSAADQDYPSRVRNAASGFLNRFLYGKWRRKATGDGGEDRSGVLRLKRGQNQIIWMLGRPYMLEEDDKSAYEEFLVDFRSRIYFSYRDQFAPLLDTGVRSDCGWGCMLRCAQMMLAEAVLHLNVGRDFRLSDRWDAPEVMDVIRLFEDCEKAPLGIHRLMRIAERRRHSTNSGGGGDSENETKKIYADKKEVGSERVRSPFVGRWFSPSEVFSLMKESMENLYGESLERDSDDGLAPIEGVPPPLPLLLLLLLSNLRIYLSVDNNVVLDEVRRLADGWQRAVLVVVCVRLGTRHINKVYYNQLKSVFAVENCCGAVGGQPKRAHYFVGHLGDQLYYLDPHEVHKYRSLANSSVDASHGGDTDPEAVARWQNLCRSFHRAQPETLPIGEADPSCAIGFLLRSESDLQSCLGDLYLAKVIEYKPKTSRKVDGADDGVCGGDDEDADKCGSVIEGERGGGNGNGWRNGAAAAASTPLFTVLDRRPDHSRWSANGMLIFDDRPPVVDGDGFELL